MPITSRRPFGILATALIGLAFNGSTAEAGQFKIYFAYANGSAITSGTVTVVFYDVSGATEVQIGTPQTITSGATVTVNATNKIVKMKVMHSAGGSTMSGPFKGDATALQTITVGIPASGSFDCEPCEFEPVREPRRCRCCAGIFRCR